MELADVVEAITSTRDRVEHPIVVGISGYAGSGKSTLARALQEAPPGSVRMRGDDFLDPRRSHQRSRDWDGVDRQRLVTDVLEPFRACGSSTFQRFDWSLRTLGPREIVPSADVMLLDLIGLFHPDTQDAIDLRIWCDVDLDMAAERGIQRDARQGRRHDHLWHDVWIPNERDFAASYNPRGAADILFTGTTTSSGPTH